ncbi:hypothetical protein SKAU_G00352300 [Synaphobranchus kaupii]|uniref:Retropepsins domain-containing protein n=1 Tax=Synaphobranchus kaupii TaxID=118154 RepID=A0A9Q1EKR8_SYNKA|nr:hypothetical protein SKAU_G00352300 [Synaphobranchus kaupii]
MERALLREMEELERTIGKLTRRKASGRLPRCECPGDRTASAADRRIRHRREKLLSCYRCKEESWGKVAADVQRYAHEAYPEFDAAAQEKLALHAFLRALTPERLCVRVADGEEVRYNGQRGDKATEAPAIGKRGRDGAVSRTPPRKPTLLNQVHTPVPKPSPALPAPVAKIPATSAEASTTAFKKATEQATSAEASTTAFKKATEHNSHPRVGRLGKASGLYLHCQLDGQACRALVDTGATISHVRPGVLHNTGGPQLPGAWTPTTTPLTSVTGAKMAMRGRKEVKVTVTGQEVSHEFWLADIADSCIIGLDLLKRWGACVDVSRASITLGMETPATQQPPAQPKPALPAETTAAVHTLWQRSSSGLDHQQRQQLKSLLDGNADLFVVPDEDCTQTKLVQHTINTDTAQPIRLRPHRMSPAKRLVAEEKVKEMAAAGVMEPSDSPWAAPAVLVQKKSGEWRFCVDYRRLNSATTKDSYSLPRIDEALDHISGSSWFSSLDLRSGY